ncbi:MAG: PQQ-binding-like beta-propeller repeat protein [Sedimentisphaerales bacterium]|nr:PQQ-binding-like beta-propeller repeat protein [Sedimentisphaerales bacterium]
MKRTTFFSILPAMIVLVAGVRGADCPRFRGPDGDGLFPESGLLKQWPQSGPKLAWSIAKLGQGFSSAVVVDGTIYVTGMDAQNEGYLIALNLDGSPKWKVPYGLEIPKKGPAVAGTRGTPNINGGQIFLMTGYAKLITFDLKTGKLMKAVDLLELSGAKQARFGFAECVLIDGRKVICTPGGPDASLMALDRKTGEKIWQTKGLSQEAAYCSARLIRYGGRRFIITLMKEGIVAVDPETGKMLWQHEQLNRYGVRPTPPLYADGCIYFCAGGGSGGVQLALADDGLGVTEKWTDKTLDPQMHGVVLVDGCIYGTAQSANRGLVCLDWKTGNVMWNAPEVKMASVVSADGMLYVYGEDGIVRLVKPSREAFTPVGQFTVTQGAEQHWAHPTIANGRLYIRHGDALMAYDIKS